MNAERPVNLTHLSHYYGKRKALSDVSFTVEKGELFGLLGPNGGGKTTLFHILSTMLRPSEGVVSIFGYDVVSQPAAVRRRIGVVFQAQNLDRKLTARENLRHQGHFYGMSGKPLEARIDLLLEQVGLRDRADERVEIFSGGQKRRVEITKGLLHSPELLLLDEPSTGLDPGARRALWDYLEQLRQSTGVTILLTTHFLEEADQCDRLAILDDGRIISSGPPDKLKQEVGGEVILVDAHEPNGLHPRIQERFSVEAAVVSGKVRFEHPRGHEFIPQLIEAFPGEIQSVMVAQPTLEDVFIRRTGHSLWDADAAGSTGPSGAG